MAQQRSDRGVRRLALVARACLLLVAVAGCGDDEPAQPGSPGGTAGSGGAGGGRGGTGGASTGSGTGGAAGTSGGSGGSGGGGGMAGSGGSAGSPDARRPDAGRSDSGAGRADGGSRDGAPAACGLAGQACCAENACTAPATPSVSGGMGAGMTVLELKASGGDPYALFREKNLLPIDGPDSGYITDTGTSFLFVLHQNGAEETVSSGAQRQRNEVTVNPPNPAIYKGTRGDTMTYTWRFKIDQMNANPTWCDVFQIKQHGPLGVAPYFALEAYRSDLTLDTQRSGRVATVPLSQVMNTWINASMTLTYADAGRASLTLKKDDGTVVMSYNNNNIDLWDTDVDFVRPKWGLYRNKANGAGEAAVHYNDMKIIRGSLGPTCDCR